ncbi:MAG TPA: aspartyl protease family protein [Terriglobales bacterium]|nr:aspartyl protease family protein [Terriglobales bacterium]
MPVSLLALVAVALVAGSAEQTAEALKANGSRNIPIRIVRSELLVPALVNGQQLTFILDSGAHSFFLDQNVANRMKLTSRERVRSFGAGDSQVLIPQIHGLDIEFAGSGISGETAGIIDLAPISAYLNMPIDGVAGAQVFSRSVIAIDYCRQQIRVTSPEIFVLPSNAIVRPITEIGGNYATEATLHFAAGKEVKGMFLLDTGAGPITIGITRQQGERLSIDTKSARQETIPALGGNFRAGVVAAESINVGGASARRIDVHVAENTSGGLAAGPYTGVIGGGFFRRFLTIFDVPHGRLVLVPAQKCEAGSQ